MFNVRDVSQRPIGIAAGFKIDGLVGGIAMKQLIETRLHPRLHLLRRMSGLGKQVAVMPGGVSAGAILGAHPVRHARTRGNAGGEHRHGCRQRADAKHCLRYFHGRFFAW